MDGFNLYPHQTSMIELEQISLFPRDSLLIYLIVTVTKQD